MAVLSPVGDVKYSVPNYYFGAKYIDTQIKCIFFLLTLFLPLFDTKANCFVSLASRKRHSKTASSETSGGPEEGELVPTKKKSRRTRESKEPKNENTEPREEGQRTPTP